MNITDQGKQNYKQIASELRDSLGWMDLVLSNISEGILVVESDLTITFANDVIADIIGLPRITLLGKPVWEVLNLTTGGKKIGKKNYQQTLVQENIKRLTGRYHLQGKNEVIVDITTSYIHTLKQATFIIRDVTQQVQTEQELVKEQKSYQEQLRSLVSELSKAEEQERHRLATELHDNLGQILAMGKMKVDKISHARKQSSAEIDELRELLEDAITYTRELMSELKPPPSLKDEALIESIKWIAKKMEKHGLKITIEDDKQPKPLSGEVQITLVQCVRELLFNVVKHTSVNKSRIEINRINQHVLVTIEDKGAGFDTDKLKSAPSKEKQFGLFNIRERIDLLGGDVEIDSTLGEGTKVTLDIPVKESENVALAFEDEDLSTPADDAGKANRKINVLLVDDHKMVRQGLRNIIEKEDDIAVVGEAADGEEAIHLTKELSPDVILMDVNMPNMDGIEATEKIMSYNSHVCIIGLSLHDDKEVIKYMRKVGASAYLTKNEAFETLSATIRSEVSINEAR